MKNEVFDVAVLGLGIMGSATLYELAKQGLKVCGIEQFDLAHDKGSSHGETRMIRKAYFEHPDYMPLLDRAYVLWPEIEAACGKKLMVNNGLILSAQPDSVTIRGLDRCYREHTIPHERMQAHEAKKRFPQFCFDDEQIIYHDPGAGFLYAERCMQALTDLARRHGATLYPKEKVREWQAETAQVKIKTDKRIVRAKQLVITAGAWACPELHRLGIEMEIWRKVAVWYDSPNIADYQPEQFPDFYFENSTGTFYGFPSVSPLGLKVGEHSKADPVAHPDMMNRDLSEDDESPLLQFVQKTFSGFKPARTKSSICMYAMTSDGHFIIDLHPRHDNVMLAAGFSGHGFKFAPVIGEILSGLCTEGTTEYPVDFLRLKRFKSLKN